MRKPTIWVQIRSDTNRPVQSQKMDRGWKFWIKKVQELYYPCRENKGADQLCNYCEADLRICFRLCRLLVLSLCMRKPTIWVQIRSDTNQPVQSQKMDRGWKFWIKKVQELYYPCMENKGADQLCNYCEADLRICFRLCRLLVFPCGGSITFTLKFLFLSNKKCLHCYSSSSRSLNATKRTENYRTFFHITHLFDTQYCFFVLKFNIPFNNFYFLVMSGQSHHFLGINH